MAGSPENTPTPLAERLVRWSAAATVIAVAGLAAIISYTHISDLGRAHGGPGIGPQLLPLSVDGLILASSLVLLHEALAGRPAPRLARAMLWLGVGATVAANVAYGAQSGAAGAIIWAWPAISFVGAAEILMQMIRRSHQVLTTVAETAEGKAKAALAASIAAGNRLSQRQLASQFGIGRAKAASLIAELAPEQA